MKNILKIFKLLGHMKWQIVFLCFVALLSATLGVLVPYVFSKIIDQIIKLVSSGSTYPSGSNILGLMVIFGITTFLDSSFDGYSYYLSERFELRVQETLRLNIYEKLLKMDVPYFETSKTGEILQKINNSLSSFINWLLNVIWQYLDAVFILVITGVVITIINPLVGLLYLVFSVVYIFIFLRVSKKVRPIDKKMQKQSEIAFGHYTESLTHVSTIRTLSAEKLIRQKYNAAVRKSKNYGYRTVSIWSKSILARGYLTQLVYVMAFSILIFQTINHQITIGQLIFAIFVIQQFVSRIWPLSRFLNQTLHTDVAVSRLVEVFETQPILVDSPDAEELLKLYSIEFKNVSFTYPKSNKDAVENVSFKIEPGKTIALVGPSGVGKSTITKLLLRFYAPDSGQILINGEDIGSFTQDSLRTHIGMVMQDVALFNTTIEENLSLANARASKAQIRAAAHQAHAAEFIDELPKKYKTLVGERGIKLSGGQKQRVAIARAILKNPNLIILDEATSALDSESERLVQAGLKKLMSGRSALVIAHRLSTVMHADEIIVLKKGRITERGNHQDLIKQDGLYAKLFQLQSASGQVKL